MARKQGKPKGPYFVTFFDPVLEALKELGGSGRPAEVIDLIADKHKHEIPEELYDELDSGATRFSKYVHWARFYLAKDGYIDASQRGIWTLTAKGHNTSLSHDESLAIFYRIQQEIKGGETGIADVDLQADIADDGVLDDESRLGEKGHRAIILNKLRNLSPDGFERFCQLLLRFAGFEQVKVTGRSGDGGIDGHGIVKINQFVSFQVAFQSKRYGEKSTVGSGVVRDFRGAMMGRADKGIIITTGMFSSDARKEAVRDGATPVELVDGEKILDMLEELELGVKKKPVIVYEVDMEFFDKFE